LGHKFNKIQPNPDEPELKIEDCPPAAEIFVDVARAAQAIATRVAPSFLKLIRRTLNLQYSIGNIQSLENSENIPSQFFCHKMHKNNN
jgi:hypothetical protein